MENPVYHKKGIFRTEKHVLRPDPYKHRSEIIETEKIRVFQTHLYLQDIALTFCLVYSLLYLVIYDMYCHYLRIVTNEVPPIHSVSYSLYIETIFRLVANNKSSNFQLYLSQRFEHARIIGFTKIMQ